jgi:hypothetical protein
MTYTRFGLTMPIAPGCPGTLGVPFLATPGGAHLGGPMHLSLSNLVPAVPIAAFVIGLQLLPMPVDLTGIGLPGCVLHSSLDLLVASPALAGQSNFALAIPWQPALLGANLYSFGLSFDPVNAFGAVLSNTLRVTIEP